LNINTRQLLSKTTNN